METALFSMAQNSSRNIPSGGYPVAFLSLSVRVVLLYKVYIVDQEECARLPADVLEAVAELVGG